MNVLPMPTDHPPIVGKMYMVPCVFKNEAGLHVPVIGPHLADPEIGTDDDHIHIDIRFISDRAYQHVFGETIVSEVIANTSPNSAIEANILTSSCRRRRPELRLQFMCRVSQEGHRSRERLIASKCVEDGNATKREPFGKGLRACSIPQNDPS